jgi:hypothetical protein
MFMGNSQMITFVLDSPATLTSEEILSTRLLLLRSMVFPTQLAMVAMPMFNKMTTAA